MKKEKRWVGEDYESLIDQPVSDEEFHDRYFGQIIPPRVYLDIIALAHLHKEELRKLRKRINKK